MLDWLRSGERQFADLFVEVAVRVTRAQLFRRRAPRAGVLGVTWNVSQYAPRWIGR
jgi:hypothetical protein